MTTTAQSRGRRIVVGLRRSARPYLSNERQSGEGTRENAFFACSILTVNHSFKIQSSKSPHSHYYSINGKHWYRFMFYELAYSQSTSILRLSDAKTEVLEQLYTVFKYGTFIYIEARDLRGARKSVTIVLCLVIVRLPINLFPQVLFRRRR